MKNKDNMYIMAYIHIFFFTAKVDPKPTCKQNSSVVETPIPLSSAQTGWYWASIQKSAPSMASVLMWECSDSNTFSYTAGGFMPISMGVRFKKEWPHAKAMALQRPLGYVFSPAVAKEPSDWRPMDAFRGKVSCVRLSWNRRSKPSGGCVNIKVVGFADAAP